MLIHGVWTTDGLAFWAETTDPTTPERGGSGGARDSGGAVSSRRTGAVRPHPFAASSADVAAALGLDDVPSRTLELLLPGSAKEPLPSPETGRLTEVSRPRLRLWRVPAVLPAVPDALDAPAAHRGTATMRHWSAVAAFARDLVRRGRVLPRLIRPDQTESTPPGNTPAGNDPDGMGMWAVAPDDARAGWRPVLTGADAAYFRELALAMPPACRTSATERPSAEVLGQALETFADAVARAALTAPLIVRKPRTTRERWLAALAGDAPACPDDPELHDELERWHDSVVAAEGATRMCFRLLEPEDTDDWQVELALQATDDPSLYVPAAALWDGVTGLPGRPERDLLSGLGRAVRLYPELDRALRVPKPSVLELDTAGAFGFLRSAAPLLQAAGFGVQLPRWAGRTRLGLKLTTRTKTQSAAAGQGFGMAELLDFRVDLAVGEETISEEELAELARLKVPLVRVRGQWVELDDRQLKAALRAVEGGRTGEASAADLLREIVQSDDELPLLAVDADGALGDLLSGQAERRLTPLATPPGLDATLRPYQERGLAWLSFLSGLGLGGVLADDMGLGKTITTLALLVHEGPGAPTLLVCPMSLVGNWQREAARFAPDLRVYVHHGSGRDAAEIKDADLVITTYGTAQRDLETLKEHTWRRVVCDEAQAIKNSGTLQARAVRAIPAESRLALTGTPVENHLAELWSIMEFANPGLLGPRSRFRTRFQEPIEARQDEQAARALKQATGPFILRRLKTDKSIISDLPEKLEVKEWCPLTTEQATLYRAVVDDMLARINDSEGIERRGLVLSAMARLKQVCNHPAHLLKDGSRLAGRSGKLARLEQLAEEILAEGEKALLFTQYAEFGTMLQPYLAQRLERPVLWLHGGLPKKTRDRLVDRFQHDDEPTLFVLSLKAAGVGLNLTAANHVIHVDRWWNPAVEDQATDRAFRIGQRKNVQVRKLICAGTLEERVDEMIERKKALAERVVGTGEEWLTDLSTEELREVFALTAEGVS
ncbi:DEAD/DEAH box helicase [Nonomuraea sp. NPDC048892]|uniref:DEAD/DEAH box helicase n=1 Tax=Nonomuraea sp. NPDC048892 TaxID=3154624 RepID=UPI0034047D58